MNGNGNATWSPMVSGTDELENLFDFGDLQLDYSALPIDLPSEDMSLTGGMEAQMAGSTMLPYKDFQEIHGSSDSLDFNIPAQMFQQQQQHPLQHLPQYLPHHIPHQHRHQHQQQQQQHRRQQHHFPSQSLAGQYSRHAGVPPTPTSMEMHAMPSQAYTIINAPSRVMFDASAGKSHHQVTFTPLVSPAVTPLDTQLRMPEYGTSRESFTPLVSPALEAQNSAAQLSMFGTYRGSDTSETASPIDLSGDLPTNGGIGHSTPRKPKKRSNPSISRSATRPVRSSPAMKPQQKKKQSKSISTIPPREIAELLEAERPPRHSLTGSGDSGKLSLPTSHYSSEAGSISPEPLTEVLMPPPTTSWPGSMARSPFMAAQASALPVSYTPLATSPATPASLMRIQKNGTNAYLRTPTAHRDSPALESDLMEDITLPEPATTKNKRPRPMRVSTLDDQAVQARSSRPGPTSVPVSPGATLLPSPSIQSLNSPAASMLPTRSDLKTNGKRGNKRTSSMHVSPALRPRISPSIQPLLPDGAHLTPETSALYLASKSNYQNILEGTHLPGVEYPEALSENLSSKRTSHKLAEQSRRNRINNALQEMAALLPPAGTPAPSALNIVPEASSDLASAAASSTTNLNAASATSSSKASTVELAIEYIKTLRSDRQALEERLRASELRLRAAEIALGRSTSPDDTSMAEEAR